MKNILLIFILSLCYTNFSYQSLLLPNSTYDLVSGYSKYSISKKILFNEQIKKNVEFSIIMLPQDIQTTSIDYIHSLFNYYHYFSINIIDYGKFTDSESNSTFSAKDIIIKNSIFKKITNKLHGSLGLNYINSHIEDYSSSALCMQSALFINHKNFLFQTSINNYGFIINHYTSYNEILPTYYNFSIMYLPQYLESTILVQYNSFEEYNITNLFGELFITDDYSITAGYTSLAQKLYSEDFNSNFFTGVSIGLNIGYKDYIFNIGIKNLGSIGLINSITINKSFN